MKIKCHHTGKSRNNLLEKNILFLSQFIVNKYSMSNIFTLSSLKYSLEITFVFLICMKCENCRYNHVYVLLISFDINRSKSLSLRLG